MIARASAALALALLIAACGGAAPEAQTPASGESVTKSPGKPASGKSIADLKRDFMTVCGSKTPNAPDYCECRWDQTIHTFTEDELNAPDVDKAKLAVLEGRVGATCKAKIPEELFKAGFVKGCVGAQPRNAAYCECTWGSFRKSFSAAELDDAEIVKSERFTAARKASVKVCGAKMSEDASREDFGAACTKGDAANKPVCDCAWKALRATASAAEIQSNLIDVTKVKLIVEKACAKLRPAAH